MCMGMGYAWVKVAQHDVMIGAMRASAHVLHRDPRDNDVIPRNNPPTPLLTQHAAANHHAAPTHGCTGAASTYTGPRRTSLSPPKKKVGG